MGNERLFPPGEVDPIPKWIYELVVRPIVRAGIISDEEYINSVVINDYEPKGEERARARVHRIFTMHICYKCRTTAFFPTEKETFTSYGGLTVTLQENRQDTVNSYSNYLLTPHKMPQLYSALKWNDSG